MSKDKITVNMNIYDIPILVEELEKADKEINRLNNIIDKAIEYIKKNMIDEELRMYEVSQIDVRKLLSILRGDDNE